jgi:threonine aldolase
MIDFRSDTVTKPTPAMRAAMSKAIVGDDVYHEDPTVIALEQRVAAMFGKESALFFPSGTMSNLCATLTWCKHRGSEIIVGDKSHMFLFEQAGAAQFGGISYRTLPNMNDGTMDIESIRLAIRDDDIHEPQTKLICIENTHNACGGKVLPLSFLQELRDLSLQHRIPVHVDGARIWNALAAMQLDPASFGEYVDSLSVCLSKGLGAPVGSLLVGSIDFITKARRIRKALGGGMRQAGIIAAAGLIALDDFKVRILHRDHIRTRQLAEALAELPIFEVYPVETNILFARVNTDNRQWPAILKSMNVVVSVWEPFLMRVVVHRDIDDNAITRAIEVFRQLSAKLA